MSRFMRLQKFLACAGIASRRKCEEAIQQGRVEVSRETVTSAGVKVDPERDEIRCDGEVVRPEKKIYIILDKPKGFVCSRNAQGGRSVFELVKTFSQRLFTVGRLDSDSEGLIILTNDGEFAAKCSHPKFGLAKTYRVIASGSIPYEKESSLSRGAFTREGRITLPGIEVVGRRQGQTELEITLREGKNRHIRRVLAAHGLKTKRLIRIAIGNLRGEGLMKGRWRRLSPSEIAALEKEMAK